MHKKTVGFWAVVVVAVGLLPSNAAKPVHPTSSTTTTPASTTSKSSTASTASKSTTTSTTSKSNTSKTPSSTSTVNSIGKGTYEHHCAACHVGGDNRDNPNKPLAGSSKLKDLDTFKKFVGAGHVQFAQQLIDDKKSFEALYNYCKSLPKVASKESSLISFNEED